MADQEQLACLIRPTPEDIITDLSKVSALNILSRNTVFAFKGKSVDLGQIASLRRRGRLIPICLLSGTSATW